MKKSYISNPKRNAIKETGKAGWYSYYAGFSTNFVRDVLKYIDLPEGSTIMDPWNGSGTTTQIVNEMGYIGLGYDINPAMGIIAKARQLKADVVPSLNSIRLDILNKSRFYSIPDEEEPFERWLQKPSAQCIRRIDYAIHQLLIDEDKYLPLYEMEMDKISSLAAFYYVALFRTARTVLKNFNVSNPTWIKIPRNNEEKTYVSESVIFDNFSQNISDMIQSIDSLKTITGNRTHLSVIRTANSVKLPIDAESIDGVITSPPYCTRIDYAVATLPELAVCGIPLDRKFKDFRRSIIGTPTISTIRVAPDPEWGAYCQKLLTLVYEHASKASQTYYYKTYLQYFASIFASILEINRVLKKQGNCVVVLQDSYYKDIHIDLPRVFEEMSTTVSWRVQNKIDYVKPQTMAGINQGALFYRKSGKATESVLVFKKD